MRQDIEFHCGEEYNFPNPKNRVRAFLYRDYSIQPHSHDFYEINIVMGGSGTHRIEYSYINVRRGDVYVIPPNALHAYLNTKNLDVYHIIIHRSFIRENISEAEKIPGFLHLTEIEPFVRGKVMENSYLHLNPSDFVTLRNELDFIEENGEYDAQELIPMKEHTVWKLIYWFSHLMHRKMSENSEVSYRYEQAIIDTLEYIHNNFGDKITVDILCSRVYMSRSTFLRCFYRICGCTPMKYLTECRCRRALDMISTSDLSKTDIAQRCGFYDLSHMERILKKEYK